MAARKNTEVPRGRHAKGAMPQFGSRTDIGLVRDHNEDSLTVTPPLFAVADGMGGHAAGEIASEVAIEALVTHAPDVPDGDDLARAVVAANRAVISAARDGLGRKGMGTTMTAAMLSGRRLVVAQVGDSRAYLLNRHGLQRITRDHSLMADLIEAGQITEEEAKTHPQRSVITRALGSDPNTLPDIYEMNVEAGDKLLLCSDGLSGMVEESLLQSTLERIDDPQKCVDLLVQEAIDAGGYDNVTAIVVNVEGNAAQQEKKARRHGRLGAIMLAVVLVAVLVGAAFGVHTYLNTTAFVTVQNSEVVICRGLNGSFLGIQMWQTDSATGIKVDDLDLPANTKERLTSEGIQTDSVEEAKALVQTWQDQAKKDESASGGSTQSSNAASGNSEEGSDSSDANASGSDAKTDASSSAANPAQGGDAA